MVRYEGGDHITRMNGTSISEVNTFCGEDQSFVDLLATRFIVATAVRWHSHDRDYGLRCFRRQRSIRGVLGNDVSPDASEYERTTEGYMPVVNRSISAALKLLTEEGHQMIGVGTGVVRGLHSWPRWGPGRRWRSARREPISKLASRSEKRAFVIEMRVLPLERMFLPRP